MKKPCLLLVILIICIANSYAQNWVKDMHNPRVNFFTVQQEFNAWWAANKQQILARPTGGAEDGEQGELWKNYKRWERQMLPRMVATHGVRLGTVSQAEKDFYLQKQAQQTQRSSANWTYIGPPMSFDDSNADSVCGRVNCVRFDPLNHNVIYCGAPTGGLWKSSDFGHSWQLLNTDNLPQIGVSDVVINPQNTNTLYIATGDYANEACESIGVLKSTDGGQTWDTTGLSFTVSQSILISRLLMSPLDSNTMFAATNLGVYKTVDGAITWSHVYTSESLTGMDFNPLNPNTIYTWGTQLYKSVDAGATWAALTSGLPPADSSGGFGVGLTPADTSCIYVLASGTPIPAQSDMPYKGVYRSLNSGASFTRQSDSPDATGTQGTYDLTVGVSPVNRDLLFIGAVQMEGSTDGGVTWGVPFFPMHVDHHDIRFFNGSADTLFNANDGGLFISTDTGNTWQALNNGMHIGQIYNISSGDHTHYLYLSGRQDEGTVLQDTSSAIIVSTGDGLECLIDPLNENHLIGSIEDGIIGETYNLQQQGIIIMVDNFGTGIDGEGAWNTPFAIQGDNSSIVYVAKDYVYKSVSGGVTGTYVKCGGPALPANDNLYQLLAVAQSNPAYVYAASYYHLYRSTDTGATFVNITGTLNGFISALAVSQSNPEEVFIGFNSGSGPALLKSIDAGSHFATYGAGLPASGPFYPQCIASVRNSKDAFYIGLANAGGVYYIDSTMSSWMPYNNGLPNVTVDQLEIDYCAQKIRAATYGRDIWETDPYQPINVPPIANATFANTQTNCVDTVSFTDASDFNPTSWQWTFPGGQPASSTNPNPAVVYPNGNSYTATLIVANTNGADTAQYTVQTPVCTGVNQLTGKSTFAIYPNPANNYVTIDFDPLYAGGTVLVKDIAGRSVMRTRLTGSPQLMPITNLPAGVYMVTLYYNGQMGTQLLVKE